MFSFVILLLMSVDQWSSRTGQVWFLDVVKKKSIFERSFEAIENICFFISILDLEIKYEM